MGDYFHYQYPYYITNILVIRVFMENILLRKIKLISYYYVNILNVYVYNFNKILR